MRPGPEDQLVPGGAMVIVHAPHERVARQLRGAHLTALVGPTSTSGWTCVWLDDESELAAAGWEPEEYLSIRDAPSVGAVVSVRDANGTEAVLWSSEGAAIEPSEAASTLARMFDAWEHRDDLEVLFSQEALDADDFEEALAGLLRLPALSPGPAPGVVVCDGDPAKVRMAAGIAGPASVSTVGRGWLAIAAPPGAGGAEDLAAAISAVVRRRDHTLVLWREADSSGVQNWVRSQVQSSWSWGGWELTDHDLEAESRFCEMCASISPDIHMPALRALLRRWTSADPLAELIELLTLPDAILGVVEATATGQALPDAVHIDRVPIRRAWWAAVTSDATTPKPVRHRGIYGAYAVATALAALVSLVMTALAIAVITTDGSVIEQPGHSLQDWVAVVAFALLTAILVPTATIRIRKLLARPRTDAGQQLSSDLANSSD